jgi:membrane protease YdiL (CAAX protease family)
VLSVHGWNAGAVARLAASLFVCQLLGAAALALIRCWYEPGTAQPWWGTLAALAGAAFSVATLVLLHQPDAARAGAASAESPSRLRRVWLFATLACLYAAMVAVGLAQQLSPKGEVDLTLRTVLAALCFQGAALILVHRFVAGHGVGWREAFGFGHAAARAVGWGAVATAVFLPVAQLLQIASAALMTRLDLEPASQPAVEALRQSAAWPGRALMAVVAVGLAPVAEEILFRGILYPALKQAGFRRAAWWGTALLFAAVHWNMATFLPLLLFALLLTWLYERTNNLLAPIAAHALFNAVNFAMFYVAESAMNG